MYENGKLAELEIRDILPNRFQPRIHFDEQKLIELSESIRKYGVIQPIVVRPINNKYEIIAGERRYKASVLANRATIPAIIVNLSDKESEEIALLENIQRQELTAIEEAVSYKRILDMGYITQEALAKKLGKAQSTIANKIRLLNLDDQVQDALLHGKISERHARSLLRINNKNMQVDLLNRIIKERLTVKRTDEEIKKILNSQTDNTQKIITERPKVTTEPVETLVVTPTKLQATPVGVHELNTSVRLNNKEERGQGFMDIDRIMKEAQDINVTPPANDISELMKQDATTVKPEPVVAPVQQPTAQPSEIDANKFINFSSAVRESEPVKAPEPVQESVSFDSIFNQKPVDYRQPVESNLATQITPQPMPEPQVPPTPTPMPAQEANVTPTPVTTSEPVYHNLTNNIPETPVYNNPGMTAPYQPPVQPVTVDQPVVTNIPGPDILEASQPTIQPVSTATPATQPSLMDNIVKPVPEAPNSHNFREVINLIRQCADQVEKLGYYIDVDELDLENSYQVVFKIDKQ